MSHPLDDENEPAPVTFEELRDDPSKVFRRVEIEGTVTLLDADGKPRLLLSVFRPEDEIWED